MQTRQVYFYKIGVFSEVNHIVPRELAARFPHFKFRIVDVQKEIINRMGSLKVCAFMEVVTRYGWRMMQHKIPPRDFFSRIPCVLSAIQKWAADNIQPSQTAFTFQTQSLFDARREGVPHFVYTDHTYLANRRYENAKPLLPVAKRWKQMERELYQKANLNFTFSQFAADSIIEDYGVPSVKVQCVYSGPNTGFPFNANTGLRTGQRILFIATDWKRKGGPELLEAFLLVRRDVPDAELIVIGSDPGIFVPGMTVFDRVPVERLRSQYQAADIFCLPSRMDPSANVLVEAAAHALPVVATSVGGNKERVIDGKTGFLVPPGDIHLLAKRLCRLLKDPQLRADMGRAGRQRVMENFHWSGVIDRITHAIEARI